MNSVRITVPVAAEYAIRRETLDDPDQATRRAIIDAFERHDGRAPAGPAIDVDHATVRMLARAVGRALFRFEPSTTMRRMLAPERAALRRLRARLQRHAALQGRTAEEGYVVVSWYGRLASQYSAREPAVASDAPDCVFPDP